MHSSPAGIDEFVRDRLLIRVARRRDEARVSFARMRIALGLPLMLEGSRSRFAADQDETQEGEGLPSGASEEQLQFQRIALIIY